MSELAKKVITWAIIILVISYLFNLNLTAIIHNVITFAQTMHNSH